MKHIAQLTLADMPSLHPRIVSISEMKKSIIDNNSLQPRLPVHRLFSQCDYMNQDITPREAERRRTFDVCLKAYDEIKAKQLIALINKRNMLDNL
jgi:hypothetical protein